MTWLDVEVEVVAWFDTKAKFMTLLDTEAKSMAWADTEAKFILSVVAVQMIQALQFWHYSLVVLHALRWDV